MGVWIRFLVGILVGLGVGLVVAVGSEVGPILLFKLVFAFFMAPARPILTLLPLLVVAKEAWELVLVVVPLALPFRMAPARPILFALLFVVDP